MLKYKQLSYPSMKFLAQIERILVPVPLNRNMIAPINQAIYFHEKFGSDIVLLHVESELPFIQKWFPWRIKKKHRKKALKRFRRQVKHFFPGNPLLKQFEYQIVTGKLIPSIMKVSKRRKSDLVIIKKARRAQGKASIFRKENADKLISDSKCPVMTIFKEPKIKGINRILLPVDITKNTDIKVAWAVSLAKKFGASIHIVSVQHLEIERVHSLSYNKGRRIEQDIKNQGIDVDLVLLKAEKRTADEVVLDYAAKLKPDLLMIMTHQETILFDNYLGAFAREIVHKSRIPVISIVPRKDSLIHNLLESMEARKPDL
jgi:nucleotide-binding universal stress UspA family protein